MKKRVGILLTLALVLLCAVALADIAIDEINFPDAAFRKVVKTLDLNENGRLNNNEIALAKVIKCRNKGISTLKGIEYLTNLRELDAGYNNLTSVKLTKNTQLKTLDLENNQLKKLDFTKNPRLVDVDVSFNELTSLTLGKQQNLQRLVASHNRLTGISLKGCPALRSLWLAVNRLPGLSLSQNTALNELYVSNNQLARLDVSPCRDLYILFCDDNVFMTLDISQNDDLATIVKTRKPEVIMGVAIYSDSSRPDGTRLQVDHGATIITTTQTVVTVDDGKYELNHKKLTATFLAPSSKKLEEVLIPDTIKYYNKVYKVVAIADSAFENDKYLYSVVMGKNIGKIGKKAFSGCSGLQYVTIYTETLKKSVVGKEAFKGIYAKCTFFVPKAQLSHYQYIVQQRAGGPLTTKFKSYLD